MGRVPFKGIVAAVAGSAILLCELWWSPYTKETPLVADIVVAVVVVDIAWLLMGLAIMGWLPRLPATLAGFAVAAALLAWEAQRYLLLTKPVTTPMLIPVTLALGATAVGILCVVAALRPSRGHR